MEIYFLILILSIVQSLFGVGILLFGTPLMLIFGNGYEESLLYLLPASAALSWSQVRDYKHVKLNGNYRKLFFLICVPLLFVGMSVASKLDFKWEIKLFVTLMLLVAFLIRTSGTVRSKFEEKLRSNLPLGLGLMGLIHGLSNMGGSVLTPLVSTLYSDKSKVLAGVSFDYAFMASFQLFILLFIQGHNFHYRYLVGVVISLTVRYFIGKRIFACTSDIGYRRLVDGLILGNAFMLGTQL